MLPRQRLDEALDTLGAVLASRGLHHGILVAGGSSLLLLGLISRPTADVDVIGMVEANGYVKAAVMPRELAEAVRDVGDAMELSPTWLNNGPASLMDFGLPHGFESRVEVRHYNALEVHIPGRFDLLCFKLYATADLGPDNKHFQDLKELNPATEELILAARWCQTHDTSRGFRQELLSAVRALAPEVSDADI